MKKFLRSRTMTRPKLIVFAIVAGIYTGIAALLPFFRDTSFQDISISFEWWILFGILIIMTSRSYPDSALNCFLFFLISQPIVYLVQVPFAGFGIFSYYKNWILWTVLTFPMGFVGYYMKKRNALGLLILTPILCFLGWHEYGFLPDAIFRFPHHLLSYVFCVVTSFLYVLLIFDKKPLKLAGCLLCAGITLACAAVVIIPNLHSNNTAYETTIKYSDEECPFDDSFTAALQDESLGTVTVTSEPIDGVPVFCIHARFTGTGTTELTLTNGEITYVFSLEIGRNTYHLEIKQ